MQESSKTKTFVIIIIAIIIVSAIGYFVWRSIGPTGISPISEWKTYLGFQAPAPVTPTPPATPKTPATEEIIWQLYSNTKYSYSFKYPLNWYLDTTNAESAFDTNKEGGFLTVSNMQNAVKLLMSNNVPPDIKSLTLTVYSISSGKTIDQFIKDKKFLTPFSKANITISSLSAKQLIYVQDRKDIAKQIMDVATVIKKDTKMFVFHYYTFVQDQNKLPQDVVTINDEIIKSFEAK